MEIKTAKNIGDGVWFLYTNSIQFGKVYSMKIHVSEDGKVHEQYNIRLGNGVEAKGIEKVYGSKEHLLKSL